MDAARPEVGERDFEATYRSGRMRINPRINTEALAAACRLRALIAHTRRSPTEMARPPATRVHSHVQQHAPSAPRRLRNHALSSFAATAVLTSMIRFAQAVGYTRMDLPLMLGTAMTPDRDRAKVYGFLAHMVNGWLFSAVYVAAFQSLRRSGVMLGTLIGLVHGIFVLVTVIPLLPGAHGRMASDFTGPQPTTRLEPPGFMALNYGRRTPIVTLLAHAVYGGLLGGFYRAGSGASGDRSPGGVATRPA